ncbi:MAG TPA: T9SS type A sorting domain-containing protein, partial [Parasegetibacter sp.]
VGVDSDGNIYVADFSDHAIRKVDITTGIITTVAGTLRSSCASGTCGDGGLATDALLNSPTSVRFDAAGNMYIADYGNHVVRKVDKITGIITTVAGTMKSSCSTAPCGDGGLATSANLNGPSGIALSTDGKLYIVEYGNHAVRMVNLGTGIISTAAGTQRSSCTTSPCGDGGIATSARLSSPFGLTLDHNNNIFIADASNAAIRKVDVTTGLISTVAGIIRSSCSVVPCGNGGDATSAQLSNPFGVAFNSVGDLFIVEYSNQAVRKVSMGVLPVTMSQILAYANNGVANLQWKALNQSGVARYEIERSADGYTFKKAGELAAKSEGLMELNYWWADPSPDFGNNFYRIKSIDLDGSYGYSETVKVNVNQKPGEIRVFPNPVTDGIMQLQINSSQLNNWEVALFDTRGQKIHAQQFTTQPGMLTKEIKLPSKIPAGTYFLHIISGNRTLRVEKVFLKSNL